MATILLPIKPQYVSLILSGQKRFEYRTRIPKENIAEIIIYSSYPVKKVVAEVEVKSILALSPEALWKRTSSFGGITKKSFDGYFKDRKTAYAYELGEVIVYKEPKKLSSFGFKTAPQSFAYVC
jgi:predicted transcriptional regulator